MPPHWPAKDEIVEGCHPIEFLGRHIENLAKITQALVRHPSAMPLNDFHCVKTNRLLMGIARKFRFDLLSFFRCQHRSNPSSINVRQNEVNTAEDREQVWNHQPPADHRKQLDVWERWSANSRAIRDRVA